MSSTSMVGVCLLNKVHPKCNYYRQEFLSETRQSFVPSKVFSERFKHFIIVNIQFIDRSNKHRFKKVNEYWLDLSPAVQASSSSLYIGKLPLAAHGNGCI